MKRVDTNFHSTALQRVVPLVQTAMAQSSAGETSAGAAGSAGSAVSAARAGAPGIGEGEGGRGAGGEAGGVGGAEAGEGGAGAQVKRKEALKASLLALWHMLHLIVAPGAVAALDPVALAAADIAPGNERGRESGEGGGRDHQVCGEIGDPEGSEPGAARKGGAVSGSRGGGGAQVECADGGGYGSPRFPPGDFPCKMRSEEAACGDGWVVEREEVVWRARDGGEGGLRECVGVSNPVCMDPSGTLTRAHTCTHLRTHAYTHKLARAHTHEPGPRVSDEPHRCAGPVYPLSSTARCSANHKKGLAGVRYTCPKEP